MSKKIKIAIDGPAGSGKSTIAKTVADRLDLVYLDTGAMYRAVTLKAIEEGIVKNPEAISSMVKNIILDLKFENGKTRVFTDGVEVTDKIRTPEVNAHVSPVSVIADVRTRMVELQQKIASDKPVIAEGRDITTVVLPDAEVKIYMDASVETRAKRRMTEFRGKKVNITLEEVKKNIEERDKIDSSREISPLTIAPDAEIIDTTDLTIDQVVIKVLEIIKAQKAG